MKLNIIYDLFRKLRKYMIYLVLNYTGEDIGVSNYLKNTIEKKTNKVNEKKWFFQSKDQFYHFNFSSENIFLENSIKIKEIIKNNLNSDFKIYLGIHGNYGQSDFAFQQDLEGRIIKQFTYKNLAYIFFELFKEIQRKKFKLALVMCYAGRSQDYLIKHDFSIENQSYPMLKSSFAFKFYNELINNYKFNLLSMTASTTAVTYYREKREIQNEDYFINYLKYANPREQKYELYDMIDELKKQGINEAIAEDLSSDIFLSNSINNFDLNKFSNEAKNFINNAKNYWEITRKYEDPNKYKSKYNKIIFNYDEINKKVIIQSKYDQKTLLTEKIY